jgi:hypothetical protein
MTHRLPTLLAALAASFLLAPPLALAQYGGPGGPTAIPDDPDKKAPYVPEDSEPKEPAQDASCPSIAVLADADRSTVFDGKGRDVTNIVYQTSLKPGAVTCKHRKNHQINIDVSAVIGATLGLAAETHEIEVPYFIAIIDPEELVVTKINGSARIVVEKGSRSAALPIESQTIKLALEEDTHGNDLEVLIGLQLDKDQLDYNRAGH